MSTVRELDLVAALNHQRSVVLNRFAQYVAQVDLVAEGHDQMETTWVESHSQALFWEALSDLVSLRRVVPNAHRFVAGASSNELLSDADI